MKRKIRIKSDFSNGTIFLISQISSFFNIRSFLLCITEKKCHIISLCRQNAGMDGLQVIRDVCSCRIQPSTWKCIMNSAKLPSALRMYGAAQSPESA